MKITGGVFEEPKLVFDSDHNMAHPNPWYGLTTYGCYEKSNKDKLEIVLLAPAEKEEQMKSLLRNLQEGTDGFPNGYEKYFGCGLQEKGFQRVDSHSFKDYEKACKKLIENYDATNVDLVMVYVPHTERWYKETPYYLCKTLLTENGFITQMVTDKLFWNLKWSYFNLASAMYTKTGQTPWVLRSDYDVDLVIGVSYSYVMSKEGGVSGSGYVGYVNLFDRYGKWMYLKGAQM